MTKTDEAMEILQKMKAQLHAPMVLQIHIDNLEAMLKAPETDEYARVPVRYHNVL